MVSFTGSTRDRAALPALRRRLQPQARRARMRRQEPGRRARRCRGPRPRRRAGRQRRLLEHGRELLGHFAADRPRQGQGRAARADRGLHARVEDGRSARPGEPRRRARQHGPLREGEVLPRHGRPKSSPSSRAAGPKGHLHRADRRRRRDAAKAASSRRRFSGRSFRSRRFERLPRPWRSPTTRTTAWRPRSTPAASRKAIKAVARDPGRRRDGQLLRRGRRRRRPSAATRNPASAGATSRSSRTTSTCELKTIWIDVSDRSVDETIR